MAGIKWGSQVDADDLTKADAFLALLSGYAGGDASRLVVEEVPAKDLLRAAWSLPVPLARDNAGVKKYLDRFKKGTEVDPVLFVRGTAARPLLIAEGFHRVVAAWYLEEATLVHCASLLPTGGKWAE